MSKISGYIIALAITAAILFLVWYFSDIVAYIVIAAVLAIVGHPLVSIIDRVRIGSFQFPRYISALLTLMAIWAAVALVFVIFVPLIFAKAEQISTTNIADVVESFKAPLASIDVWVRDMFSIRESEISVVNSISNHVGTVLNFEFINRMLTSVATTVIDIIIAIFSISFITFFFLKDENLFVNMVSALFPPKYEQNIHNAMESVTQLLMRYFRGIVTESSIMTIIVTTGLTLWGIPLQDSMLIGFCTGLLNVIPYIGPLIGICLGIFLGVMSGVPASMSVTFMMACIAGTILCAQLIDNIVLQPILYAKNASAHPLEIFIVILIAGSIAGVLGMLLAIPSYNVIRVFAKEFFYRFSVVQKLTSKI